VVDYFELLDEPRRPWLDPDLLKNKFLTISAELHPDRVHGSIPVEKERAQAQYSEMNTAYQTLRDPKLRSAHLLELESGVKPSAIQSAPGDLMDLFMRVGALCRDVDKFVEAKRAVTSPLLLVELFERGQELTERVKGLQQILNERSEVAEQSLRKLNSPWESKAPVLPLAELEQSYRTFSYLGRWSAQLQERLVLLALE